MINRVDASASSLDGRRHSACWGRLVLLSVLLSLLSACAVREQRPEGAWLDERQALFAEHPVWSVSGRLSLSDGERGGQLAFDWQANGDQHDVRLRTVMGGSQWRLRFEPGFAHLVGSDVGELFGSHPDDLASQAIGWPVPVADLAWWIRGLVPPEADFGSLRFADDGTLSDADNPPWRLAFQRFAMDAGALMPSRLQADSAPYRVRIALRNWHLESQSETNSL